MDIFLGFVSSFISQYIFTKIFSINKNIRSFELLNKSNFLRALFICISIVICFFIKVHFNFSYVVLGIILGVFMAIENIIFD